MFIKYIYIKGFKDHALQRNHSHNRGTDAYTCNNSASKIY